VRKSTNKPKQESSKTLYDENEFFRLYISKEWILVRHSVNVMYIFQVPWSNRGCILCMKKKCN